MTPPTESDVDPRLLLALGHPVRQQLLMQLGDAPASTVTLAAALELSERSVRRHLSVLLANDAIEPAGECDDADEVPYRLMVRPFLDDAHWKQVPPHRRRSLLVMTLRRIADQVKSALAAGGFEHEMTHVSLSRIQVDEQGRREMADLLAGVLEEAMQIEAESAARGIGEGTALADTWFAILHFDRSRAAMTPSDVEETP